MSKIRNPASGAFNNLPGFPNEVANVNVAGVASIDLSRGAAQKLTLGASASVSVLGLTAGQPTWWQVKLVQGGAGSFVPTFVGAKTPGGTALVVSAPAASVDIISGYWDGTTNYVQVAGLAFS